MSRTIRKRARQFLAPHRSVNEMVDDGSPMLALHDRTVDVAIDNPSAASVPGSAAAIRLSESALVEPEDGSEGRYATVEPQTRNNPIAEALGDRGRLMSAFSITYDGRRYRYNGYRYDRLADAVAYAQLLQSRESLHDQADGLIEDDAVESPSGADRTLMASLSISFEAGVYAYSGFHYDHLADAVNYANMRGRKYGTAQEK